MDPPQLDCHDLALRVPNDGDFVMQLVYARDAAFPQSIRRIGIVDQDAVAGFVGQRTLH